MSKLDVKRALKDAEYFGSLTAAEQAVLPKNPAGMAELSDSELDYVAGGREVRTRLTTSMACYSYRMSLSGGSC